MEPATIQPAAVIEKREGHYGRILSVLAAEAPGLYQEVVRAEEGGERSLITLAVVLGEALHNPDPRHREQAARRLPSVAKVTGEEAVPAHLWMLVFAWLAEALPKESDPKALEGIIAALECFIRALFGVATSCPDYTQQVINLFLEQVTGSNVTARPVLLAALARQDLRRYPEVVPQSVKVLREDKDPVARQAALRCLGRCALGAVKAVVPELVKLLRDPAVEVRREVIKLLAGMGAEALLAVKDLTAVVNDEPLAEEAVKAIVEIDPVGDHLSGVVRKGGTVRNKLIELLPRCGENGQVVLQRLLGGYPTMPPLAPGSEVIICMGEKDLTLQAEGRSPVAVPTQFSKVLLLFALKVYEGAPAEVVTHPELERAMPFLADKPESASGKKETASDYERDKIRGFNRWLNEKIGHPLTGKHWLIAKKREGYCLNPSFSWKCSDKIAKQLFGCHAFIRTNSDKYDQVAS